MCAGGRKHIRTGEGVNPSGAQRTVITLRDVHELPAEEVCNVLGVSESNQRVLLHSARARVRQVLETYLQANN